MNKKILCFLTAVLMLLLAACKPDAKTPETAQIAADTLSGYQIVVPKTMEADERAAVTQLVKNAYGHFGVLLTVVEDDVTEPGENEILIGNTNRQQSAEVFQTLKYDDYYVGIHGGKLVVRGGSSAATAAAVLKLKETVAANRGDAAFFRNDRDEFTYRHTYRFADVKINGVSASEYVLLYADARENREQTFANLLREQIIRLCGIAIPVQSDAVEASGNGIYFGGVNNPGAGSQALLTAEDGVIYLGGNDRDLFYATQILLERLNATTDGNIAVGAREELSYTAADLDLSAYGVYPEKIKVMSYNLRNAGQNTSDGKYRQLAAMMDLAGADFISVQECVGTGTSDLIRVKMKNKDSYATVAAVGIHNAIIYNKDRYTLLEKGSEQIGKADDEYGSKYDRYNFWAKFRSNESGVEFVVVSIHIDYEEAAGNAQLQKIVDFMAKTYPGLPAVMLGDYNLPEGKLKQSILTDAGFSSARETAVKTVNRNLVTYVSEDTPSKNAIIDYIYTTGMTAQYYEVMDKDFNPSDHRPILADLYID